LRVFGAASPSRKARPPTLGSKMMNYRITLYEECTYTERNYFSGKVWVHPNHKRIHELKEWCKEYVGQNNWCYYGHEKKNPHEFRFRNGEDLLAFKFKFGFI
jgi:hypothetical protein